MGEDRFQTNKELSSRLCVTVTGYQKIEEQAHEVGSSLSLEVFKHCLDQRFSKCGPQTSNITITWVPVRNENSQAPSRPMDSETLGLRLSSLGFNNPSRRF